MGIMEFYAWVHRNSSHPLDIFNKKDMYFRGLLPIYQDLHKLGIGVEVKHASIRSGEEEVILCEWKILGCHSAKAYSEGCIFP